MGFLFSAVWVGISILLQPRFHHMSRPYSKHLRVAICLIPLGFCQAQSFDSWILPGGQTAGVAGPGGLASELSFPALTPVQKSMGDHWRALISVDVHGVVEKPGVRVSAELNDPTTGKVLAAASILVTEKAGRDAWSVISSSEHAGSAKAAFDGDPATEWHSLYGDNKPDPPHWIGLQFAKPVQFSGLRYLPRQAGWANGIARDYRLEVLRPNEGWTKVLGGKTHEELAVKQRAAHEISLPEAIEVGGFRMVIESDWSGGGFGTAAEITPLGMNLPPKDEPVPARKRLWLWLPADVTAELAGKTLGLKIQSASDVVVGLPRVAFHHSKPDGRLQGRSNGAFGPDKLSAGLLGFSALVVHQSDATNVMHVVEGSPAQQAGLRTGDVLVAVDGVALTLNDLAPGWNWYHQSHEAILGKAGERALTLKRPVVLTVMRDEGLQQLEVRLADREPFSNMDPSKDPAAKAMLADMLSWLCDRQREDGSWSGDIIRTTFSALALLATGEQDHRERVRRAVDWSMKRYPKPENYGNLGFWHGAYAGILYSEWHLQTQDPRVIPHLAALRDWALAGQHESAWEVPALGHGPPHLPYGNKSLVAPSCHLLVYEALAMRCGMKSALWELLLPYMEMSWSDPRKGGHGSLGYNRSYMDRDEFWSRSGLFAMACELRGQRQDMKQAMTAFMGERHPWFRNSHAYGEPGGAWGLLSLNLAAPETFEEVMKAYDWWFSLAWEPGYGLRFTTPHMGAPYMGEEDLINAAYALVLQAPKRSLHLTGGR